MAYSYTATHTDATNVGNRMQTADDEGDDEISV